MPRYKEPYSLYPRKVKGGKKIWYYRTYDQDGQRTPGRSTGETSKTLARRYCLKLLKKGKLIPEKEMLFSAYAENWWVWDKCDYVKAKLLRSEEGKPQISKGYARDRRKDLMNYIMPEFGNSRLSNISSARVEKWLFKLTETTTLAHATINHILSCLRTMLSEAKRFGYIHHNPCDSVKSLALNKKFRGILTIDEVKKLFSGNALEEIWGGDLLHYTINMLAATTGLRRGSIMAIREENYFGNYIHVEHSYGDFGLGPTNQGQDRCSGSFKSKKLYG